MSRRRVYSNDTLAIMDRFFIALDACLQNNLFKTLKEYFEKPESSRHTSTPNERIVIEVILRLAGSFR